MRAVLFTTPRFSKRAMSSAGQEDMVKADTNAERCSSVGKNERL